MLAVPALASARKPLRVEPWVFNPDDLPGVESSWEPFSGPGNSDPALVMAKMQLTSANAAAGASVEGAEGRTLTELGFDVFNGGHCGAGAPRFNVLAGNGKLYFFGCSGYGIQTPAPDKPTTFTRIRFRDEDAQPQDGVHDWPGFGNVTIVSIDIVFDEGPDIGPDFSGFSAVDNIDVDGELVGRGHGR
ncbi:MAG TPA: hypothetical protein VF997_13650 [Polyangia bacterium]